MASKVQDLTSNWDRRQTKSKLQKATIRAFGHIHDDSSSIESIEKMMKLLELVISCLPLNQKKLYNAQKCYPGFLAWNKYWKECYAVDLKDKNDLDSLSNVDVYYETWVKECAESAKHSDFQKLWEVLMIRVTSEAICETAGSMMNQHFGKNRFLQPENFNIEMYLKFNLGPLHLLDNFVILPTIVRWVMEFLTKLALSYN